MIMDMQMTNNVAMLIKTRIRTAGMKKGANWERRLGAVLVRVYIRLSSRDREVKI